MLRILLTGGDGFIGTHLFRELVNRGHGVDVFDKKFNARCDLLSDDGIVELKRWLSEYKYDIVVHLAAQVGRIFGEDDTDFTIASNSGMTARVVRCLNDERFVYVSTSEIYGDQGEDTCWEGMRKNIPHNLYGLTKYHGEQISALYMPKGGLQVVRPSMPYGPGLPHGRGRAAIINMLWQADTEQEIPVHQGAERSWCWIGDLCRGFRMVIEEGEMAVNVFDYEHGIGCYNLGNDCQPITMYTVAHMACEIAGKTTDNIKLIPAPSNQTVVKRLSMNKLRDIGWEPTIELRQGMEKTFNEIREEWTS